MPNKQTKGSVSSFLSLEIGHDWTRGRRVFQYKEGQSSLARGDGNLQVLEHVNDNAYKLDLPGEYIVSASSSIFD